MKTFSSVLFASLLVGSANANAVSCSITGSGIYNNPPGLHVDYLCRLDAQEVATLADPSTRATISGVLSGLGPGGPVLAVYVDQRIQQIQNGAGPNGAQIKATLVNNNFLREFLVDPL